MSGSEASSRSKLIIFKPCLLHGSVLQWQVAVTPVFALGKLRQRGAARGPSRIDAVGNLRQLCPRTTSPSPLPVYAGPGVYVSSRNALEFGGSGCLK